MKEFLHVAVIDDDETLCTALAMFFETIGVTQCTIALNLAELETKRAKIPQIDVIFLDVNLGVNQPDGIFVYHWLINNGFTGRVIFMSGHARSHPKIEEIQKIAGTYFLQKPMPLKEIEALVKGAS